MVGICVGITFCKWQTDLIFRAITNGKIYQMQITIGLPFEKPSIKKFYNRTRYAIACFSLSIRNTEDMMKH